VLSSSCETVSIVGKEPLANRRSVAVVEEIVRRAKLERKSVSLITNGLNGGLLPEEVVRELAWIDVSLDGGPRTYERYRQGSWSKLQRSLSTLRERGARDIRLLQTVSATNAAEIGDMLEAQTILGADLTIFSPFQVTRASGQQSVSTISPSAFVEAVAPTAAMSQVWVAMDALYAGAFEDVAPALQRAEDLFGSRFIYVGSDPIDRGLIRVTYDGLVLSPFDSVHTRDSASVGHVLEGRELDAIFEQLRSRSRAPTLQ
jgi:MoaA/NifB/PqqE/SkfB family radical SAM enzyme